MFGCSSDLPPEPGDIGTGQAYNTGSGKTGMAYYRTYEGYAPPIDVFDNDDQIYFIDPKIASLTDQDQVFYMDIEVEHEGPSAYVYKYGHYYNSISQSWEGFQFDETTVSGSNWIKESASTTLQLGRNEFMPGENYIVTYSCKKQNGEWKCGCSDSSTCNMWMLQTFILRHDELPPEPIPPGSIITVRAWIQPTGRIKELGESMPIGVDYNTVYDISDSLGSNVDVWIDDPNNGSTRLQLSLSGTPNCEENGDNFNCHAYFNGVYDPIDLGEHIVDFGESIAIPEHVQIENGYFKIEKQGFFADNLITNDISPMTFQNRYGWYYSSGQTLTATYESTANYAYVDLYSKYSWIQSEMDRVMNSGDYVQETFDGNVVYVRQWTVHNPYYNEYTDRVEVNWMSNDYMLRVYVNGNDISGYKELVKEYLNKWPSNEGAIILKGQTNIHNPFDNEELTCTELCQRFNTTVAENSCYDSSFNMCTVLNGHNCIDNADANYKVRKDYATSCCCEGTDFNGCTSTDGLDAFKKGETIGSNGKIVDGCNGDMLTDTRCDAWGQNVYFNNVVCPNGCSDGACIKDEEEKIRIEIEPSGSDTIKLEAQLDNYEVSLDILHDSNGDGTYDVIGGDINKRLIRSFCGTVEYDADTDYWMILSRMIGKETYVIKVTDIDDIDGVDFKDYSGTVIAENIKQTGQVNIGNVAFRVDSISEAENKVTLTRMDTANCAAGHLITKNGYSFYIDNPNDIGTRNNMTMVIGEPGNQRSNFRIIAGFNSDLETTVRGVYVDGIAFVEVEEDLFEATTDISTIGFDKRADQYDMYVESKEATVECTDSDGGLNYYVKGEANGPQWGLPENMEHIITSADYCITEGEKAGRLSETYCKDGQVASISYECPNGCDNGACICDVKDALEEGETKNYTIDGTNYEVTANIITDQEPIYVKFTINGETTEALEQTESNSLVDGTIITVLEILPNEVGDITRDLVEFCLNKDSNSCHDNTDCNSNEFCELSDCSAETGSCSITPATCTTLVDPVCGCDGVTYSNACNAALNKVSVDYQGECAATNETIICTDSDGGKDATVKGTTTLSKNGGIITSYTDACAGNSVNESYCSMSGNDIIIKRDLVVCENGCNNGECI